MNLSLPDPDNSDRTAEVGVIGAEAFAEMFADIDRQAAVGLIQALASHRGAPEPESMSSSRDRFVHDLGLSPIGAELRGRMGARTIDLTSVSDSDLLLAATSAWAYPDPELEADEPLECVDWMPVVAFLVTEGVGAEVAADRLAAMALTKNRRSVPVDPSTPEFKALERSFEPHLRVWDLIGIVAAERLTELGAWLLPRAFCRSWGVDFDLD